MTTSWLEPAGWKRIEPYLDWALDLQPPQRETWLVELSTSQPDIARTLRAMLAELEVADAAGFLEISPVAAFDLAAADQAQLAGGYAGAYIID